MFRKLFKILKKIEIWTFFAITYSKFNETTLFQTNFKDNFDDFYIIKSTNFISYRIEIKIILAIIEKQVIPQF